MVKDIQVVLSGLFTNTLKEYLTNTPLTETPKISLELPKDKAHGDLTCNICFVLAKQFQKSPIQISEEFKKILENQIKRSKIRDDIAKIEAISGFINIHLSRNYLNNILKSIIRLQDKFLRSNIGRSKLVNLEFVSANPTGPLSVAHARQAAAGDSLANVLAMLGFKVKREYYLNDEGRQINLLGQSLYLRFKELQGEQVEFPEDCYQGEYIIDLAKEVKEDKGLDYFREYGLRRLLGVIEKELDDFGVKFDVWRSQKKIREERRIEKALKFLKKKNLVYEQEGAIWFRAMQFGDDKDRVVKKSDGSYTYLAPDIAYHQDKFQRGFKWLINMWGPDHHGYIPRIKAAVEALGYSKESLSVIIVQLATLYRGKEILPMSTRKGQYITLRQVLEEVGRDAARFFFLMRRTDSHLDFDLELAKKHSLENPVYYVQYAYARIANILNNAGKIDERTLLRADLSLLREEEELALLRTLSRSEDVLVSCYRILDPYPIIVYLQELAALFHRFYDRHRVIGQEKELMRARIALLQGVRCILFTFIKILGVSAPEKM